VPVATVMVVSGTFGHPGFELTFDLLALPP
jgi:hypothetical protein